MVQTENTQRRVLIVEDEPDQAKLLATILRGGGYDVSIANDGEEAQASIKERRPDVVTLDIQMPEKNGLNFFYEMKERVFCRDVPVVVVTGLTRDDPDMKTIIHRFLDTVPMAAPVAYLEKPVDADELLREVGNAIQV